MYGAVIFDDEKRPSGGCASVRGKASYRIRGTGDLATDVFWWTNLPASTFMILKGLPTTRFKRNDYMRPNMGQLHGELGLLVSRMSAARITEVTSEIFDRVMRMADSHYGLDRPHDLTLSDDLYSHIIKEDRPITPEIDEALKQSYQSYVQCETAMPMHSKMVIFRRPRIAHAMDVLATPVPGEQWEFIEESKLPPEGKRLDWLISQDRPALVRVSIKRVDHEVSHIISFGGGAREPRNWISHPELLTLSKFAKIKIEAAFLGSAYEPHPVYRDMFTGGQMGPLSTSVGILAENYMVALSTPRSFRKFSSAKDKVHAPRAAWYAASDRFHMLMPALMMHGSGFVVRGYGRGMVILGVQRGALQEARACASAAGLLAPLHVNEEIAVQSALSS